MNEPQLPTTPLSGLTSATDQTHKPKRARAPKVKKERVIDPEIVLLRQEHKKRVAELQAQRASAAICDRIVKLLPKLRVPELDTLTELVARTRSDRQQD